MRQSVEAIPARRFDRGQVVEVQIDDRLQRFLAVSRNASGKASSTSLSATDKTGSGGPPTDQ
ncbi:MAG: hypothetical protein ABSE20_18905 [Acetobacteraceae bacterium]